MSFLKNDNDDCNDNDDSENVYELERGFLRRGRLRRKLLSLSLWTIFLLLDNFFAFGQFFCFGQFFALDNCQSRRIGHKEGADILNWL